MKNEILRFIEFWKNRGDEKSDSQTFWLNFLQNILGVENPGEVIKFEKRVRDGNVKFIDGYIASTQTLIEQKSFDVSLDAKIKHGDSYLTPFEKALEYYGSLPHFENPRWIIICNFQEFRIYDMNEKDKKNFKPEIIFIENLEKEWQKFLFMIDQNALSPDKIREVKLSVQAGKLVGKLYDALLERYIKPDDKDSQRSLNIFCVRVVFLLYAEDAGLFEKNQFHNYLKARELVARDALQKLFVVLNQKPEERDPYLEAGLKSFPYVNGGLFADIDIELPQLDGEPLRIILEEMSEGFDWSGISPTIFGAVFESTLNPETRHSGGMHYTSVENIHKVIDPLFMDSLNKEFDLIIKAPVSRSRTQKLRAFQKRLANLKFLDPACGSGNFLTESYLSLRRIENKIIEALAESSYTPPKNETLRGLKN